MHTLHSRIRHVVSWTVRWSIVLLLPVLSWLALTASVFRLFPEQPDLLLLLRTVWFLGLGISFLAIAAVGLVAKHDASDFQVANLMIGAFLANTLSMGQAAHYVINLFEYLVAIGLGFVVAVSVWLWRRKKVLPADGQ